MVAELGSWVLSVLTSVTCTDAGAGAGVVVAAGTVTGVALTGAAALTTGAVAAGLAALAAFNRLACRSAVADADRLTLTVPLAVVGCVRSWTTTGSTVG